MVTRIYEGGSTWNRIIATIDGRYVYFGSSIWGAPMVIFDGARVYEGGSTWSREIARVSGNKVWLSSAGWASSAFAVANDNSIHKGESTWKSVIATISGSDKQGALAAVAALHVVEKRFS